MDIPMLKENPCFSYTPHTNLISKVEYYYLIFLSICRLTENRAKLCTRVAGIRYTRYVWIAWAHWKILPWSDVAISYSIR